MQRDIETAVIMCTGYGALLSLQQPLVRTKERQRRKPLKTLERVKGIEPAQFLPGEVVSGLEPTELVENPVSPFAAKRWSRAS